MDRSFYINMLEITGYQPKTTFWDDFSIADKFGISAIKDTYKRAFNEWKTNCDYVTELVLVLNWKIWQHHNNKNMEMAKEYDNLWQKLHQWCLDNLKDEDIKYYIRTVD